MLPIPINLVHGYRGAEIAKGYAVMFEVREYEIFNQSRRRLDALEYVPGYPVPPPPLDGDLSSWRKVGAYFTGFIREIRYPGQPTIAPA